MRIARACFASAFAFVIVACASIDEPASFTKPDAGKDPSFEDAGPFDRCRALERRFVTDVEAKVYTLPSGAQAVCVTLPEIAVPAAGRGALVFCIAGNDLAKVAPGTASDVSPNLATCAYCTNLQTNCAAADASIECVTDYAPVAGKARIMRLPTTPGAPVWIDVGGLVFERVTSRRPDGSFFLEPLDCIVADGLTLQGTLVAASADACSGFEQVACNIAKTASTRSP